MLHFIAKMNHLLIIREQYRDFSQRILQFTIWIQTAVELDLLEFCFSIPFYLRTSQLRILAATQLRLGVFMKWWKAFLITDFGNFQNHFESAKVERNLRNHLNDIKRVEAPEVIIRLLLNVLTPEKIINFSVKAKASVGPFSGHYSRSTFWLWPSSRRAAA